MLPDSVEAHMIRIPLRSHSSRFSRSVRNRFRLSLGAVEHLEPRQLLSTVPPGTGLTYHIADTPTNDWYSPNNGKLLGMAKIAAPKAWDTQRGSTKVVVADIDTGIDYRHADIYKNIWINQAEIPAAIRNRLTDV